MGIGAILSNKMGKRGGRKEYLAIFEGLERVKREGVKWFLKRYTDPFR
ncbi:MAG: hypothetical protein ABGW77_02780 [Campylobacterales bacterium]